jgi:sugar O-acyltransferase (sialic acid O-acetyltransferase NeuD family)
VNVIVIGAGGLTKVILEALETQKKHKVIGLLDDHATGSFCGFPILGKISDLKKFKTKAKGVCLGVGDRFLKVRIALIETIKSLGFEPVNAIHKTAWISPSAKLGQGLYVGPQTVIHSDTTIEDFCVVWTHCTIEHDNIVGENTFICPSVTTAGYTEVGKNVFVGMGAILFRVKIAESSTVAGGSLVTRDVPAHRLVMGSPARVTAKKTDIVYHD